MAVKPSDEDSRVGVTDDHTSSNPQASREQLSKRPKKARTARTKAAKGGSTPKRPGAGTSDQRGARKEPGNKQINANIRRELHASLFYYLKSQDKSLSALIEELLESWVDEQGGVFVPPSRKK